MLMLTKTILIASGMLGVLAVILGSFSAHILSATLEASGQKDVFTTANQYHFFHALALLAVGTLMRQTSQPDSMLGIAAVCFLFGIAFFSGSLYLLALTDWKILGAVAPLGGFFFILGWVAITIFAFRL